MAPYFFPPMWEQRRICIAHTLRKHCAHSVLEVGCGEGNVLSFLAAPTLDDHPITELYGININRSALLAARDRLLPADYDCRDLRVDRFRIELFHGNAAMPLASAEPDAMVCTEVIEHVDPKMVTLLTCVVLGAYCPRLAIFTTPNAEFNVNFPDLNYGKQTARSRDPDHKFEWTRAQFFH
ncbi:hypothetical protein BX070DRAFT_12146 [Coemansia spiralis]|nr:hypothetical protein BX070DRAFT_12146 [Coemansia spiralis]